MKTFLKYRTELASCAATVAVGSFMLFVPVQTVTIIGTPTAAGNFNTAAQGEPGRVTDRADTFGHHQHKAVLTYSSWYAIETR